jgi:integral membrane sensor domain MASE1
LAIKLILISVQSNVLVASFAFMVVLSCVWAKVSFIAVIAGIFSFAAVVWSAVAVVAGAGLFD